MLNFKQLLSINSMLTLTVSFLCLCGVLFSGPGYQFELWSLGTSFALLKWSVYICIASATLGILSIVLKKFKNTKAFDTKSILTLIISAATIGIPSAYLYEFNKIDTIADITTDLQNPPVFVDLVPIRNNTARNPLEYRAGDASTAQLKYFPNLTGLKTKAPIEEVVAHARDITLEAGLELVAAKPGEGRLEATETSFWYGFKDDVIIRATPLGDDETLVDIRSASRVGYSDGGVNGKRVMMYLNKLERRLNK